jgi:hypothetical protein
VFENRVLMRIFGCKRDEVRVEWRKMRNGELRNLYLSPDTIWQIKSRRMRWAGHVARMGEGRNLYRVLVGKPEGNSPLERYGGMGRKWTLGYWLAGWSGFTWLRIGIIGGLLRVR